MQKLENTIAELEATLANLSTQLESPFVKSEEVGHRVRTRAKEMNNRLAEWEKLQA